MAYQRSQYHNARCKGHNRRHLLVVGLDSFYKQDQSVILKSQYQENSSRFLWNLDRTRNFRRFWLWLQSTAKLLRHSNRVTSENKTIHTPPPPLHSKLFFFVCFVKVAPTATQHYTKGMGKGKLYFPPLMSVKLQKGPLRQSVSINFFAECSLPICNCSQEGLWVWHTLKETGFDYVL